MQRFCATLALRLFVQLAIVLLAIGVLLISADFIHLSTAGPPAPYVLLALSASSTTLLFLLPIIVLQLLAPASAPFRVWAELLWTSALGSAWLALAILVAYAQSDMELFAPSIPNPDATALARATALQDAVFLLWAILWSWSLWLLVLALRARRATPTPAIWCAPTSTCAKFLELRPLPEKPPPSPVV